VQGDDAVFVSITCVGCLLPECLSYSSWREISPRVRGDREAITIASWLDGCVGSRTKGKSGFRSIASVA